ncbi:MAG TPA: class E sortase [Jatrophihabitans sp.]|nr:class E sortase [Jatrophihabitans sp.]
MRFVLRGIGQTLITLGLIVLLFAVYEVWITNIFAHRAQAKVYNALQNEWKQGKDPLALPANKISTIPLGSGIAVLYIPRLGRDYHFAIVQGSAVPDDSQLEKGPAHYRDTQLPGQIGNFSVAGHRVGKGEPFLNIDKLRSGDPVIVETKSHWYVYRVLGSPAGSDPQDNTTDIPVKGRDAVPVPGREIVDPSDGDVLLPIPDHPEIPLQDTEVAIMTMTTCHPKFTASHRMIVHAQLDKSLTVNLGSGNEDFAMPASIQRLYNEAAA